MRIRHDRHTDVAYRPDIDGLRAIAVLAVLAFHAFPERVPGGFIGVDVFFVISGFLITSIILKSLGTGTFSIGEFYTRRVMRIFPSLLVVLTACLAFGWYVLLPDEFEQLGEHTAAGAAFVVNLVLAGESGYFDNAAETKPLLHLWSLGIEEQFYIVWPLLVWIAWTRRANVLLAMAGLAVVSLAISVSTVGAVVDPFYSPLTRMWELACGGLLSVWRGQGGPRVAWGGRANVLSATGLLAICVSFVTLSEVVPFPGAWALAPALGATAVIAAGPGAWVNRMILARPRLVWVGLISYPLYLWHWPLLSFATIIESRFPDAPIRIAAVSVSFVLAWLTVVFVERPLRFASHHRRQVAVALAASMVVVAGAGYGIFRLHGIPERSAANMRSLDGDIGHLEFHRYPADRWPVCTPRALAAHAPMWEGYVRCLQSQDGPAVDVAIVGDSHAEHLFIGLAEAMPQRNVAFYIRAGAPFPDSPAFVDIYRHLLASPSVTSVILTMYWAAPISGVPEGSSIEAEIVRAARALLDRGKNVYITDDVPTFPFLPDKCIGRRRLSTAQACTVDRRVIDDQTLESRRRLRAIVQQEPRIRLVETLQYFCDDRQCSMARGRDLLYRDSNHLNINGSRYIARRMLQDHATWFRHATRGAPPPLPGARAAPATAMVIRAAPAGASSARGRTRRPRGHDRAGDAVPVTSTAVRPRSSTWSDGGPVS